MKQVSKETFYQSVGRLNVHPCPERHITRWIMQDGTRRIVGKSWPGYLREDERGRYVPPGEERYYLIEEISA